MARDDYYLLIARKDGRSATRRQREFPAERVDPAVDRWRREGFNTWWILGPRPAPEAERPLISQWVDPKETPYA